MAIYFWYEIQYILYTFHDYNKHMGGTDHQDQSMNRMLSKRRKKAYCG